MKKAIREVIVVEGRYDKNALSQVVDATIITLGGFAVFNDREKLAFLRRLAEQRGLIVLTDSDGAGFVIRNYLKGALPQDRVKQAYIPDIPGKERRKRTPGKEGKLGVEGMRPAVLLEALRRAREDGCRGVRLMSGFERGAAHEFYEHNGYVHRKNQRNYEKDFF